MINRREPLDPAEAALALGIDLKAARRSRRAAGGRAGPVEQGGADPFAGRRLDIEDQGERHKLVEPLVRALPNNLDRNGWIGAGHAIKGALAGGGRELFLEFSARWENGTDDPVESAVAWDTLGDGENGIEYLVKWAIKVGTPGARAAVDAIEQARKRALARNFPELDDSAEEEAAGAAEKPLDGHLPGVWLQWVAARERLRAARPAPLFAQGGWKEGVGGFLDLDAGDRDPVPIRPAITDRLTRGKVSMTPAAPGGGKSSLLTVETVAVAWENPNLLGQSSIDWCGAVVIVSNEEGPETVRRRFRALRQIAGLSPSDQKHEISIWPRRLVLGRLVGANGVEPTEEGVAFVNALAERRAKADIALLVLDTLASLFRGVNENDAQQMEAALDLVAQIANAGFLAIHLAHHTSKAQDGKETANSFRGSSAINARIDEHSTLVPLPDSDLKRFGLSPGDADHIVKLSGQKARDQALAGTWYFKRETISLPAVDPRSPNTFAQVRVAVLRPWTPPRLARVDTQEALHALWTVHQSGKKIRRGGRTGPQPKDHASTIIAEALGISDRGICEAVILQLLEAGLVEIRSGRLNGNPVEFIIPSEPKEPEGNV